MSTKSRCADRSRPPPGGGGGRARTGGALTYAVAVTNNGPHEATWVVLDFYLQAGTGNPGWSSVSPPGIHCDTPTLAAGARWQLTFTVTSRAAWTTTTHLTISSLETDSNPDSDTARLDVTGAP
ncbi:MAG TPA: hypothetical protein VNZ58_14460 [Thermomicrobiales bacterium]|nr:hypothetical protein [Thermomicrobiales bacterium]